MEHPNVNPQQEMLHMQQQLNKLEEQVGKKKKVRPQQCPFGCKPPTIVDEPDYCSHLVGFTDADKQTVELRDTYMGRERVGVQTRDVTDGDLFSPVFDMTTGRQSTGFRVYRADGVGPLLADPLKPARNRAELQRRIAELQRQADETFAEEEEAREPKPTPKPKRKAAPRRKKETAPQEPAAV